MYSPSIQRTLLTEDCITCRLTERAGDLPSRYLTSLLILTNVPRLLNTSFLSFAPKPRAAEFWGCILITLSPSLWRTRIVVLRAQPASCWHLLGAGKTQRDRVEREAGGGIGRGNTCKPMADSCQCMAKPTTIL